MSVHADFSQVDRLAAELAVAGPKVQLESRLTLSAVASQTAAAAKAAAPVDTGALAASITVRGSGDERVVETGVPYAMFVEFGTSVMGPQPFMWPAASIAERSLTVAFEKLGDPFI